MPITHTRGPWTLDCGNVKATDKTPICAVRLASGNQREETDANARLIAAAPDLLAALSMAADEMDVAAGVAWTKADAIQMLHALASRGLRNSGDKLKAAANDIRAAIARAKGEA